MVYVEDKPIFTVCDNTVFVKKLPGGGRTYEGLLSQISL